MAGGIASLMSIPKLESPSVVGDFSGTKIPIVIDLAVRRRGSPAHGRALEVLGHAVEYLIDSRLWQVREGNHRDHEEAVQILMKMSRAVFSECPEVVTLRRRFQQWVAEKVTGDSNTRESLLR
jgi:hypothetical protein